MRIAVIGGTGFIGSALVRRIKDQREVPVVISRHVKPGFRDSVAYRRADAGSVPSLRKALSKCDVAVHCVWSTTPGESERDPSRDVENIRRTISILRACNDAKVARVVFLSSGGTVYGQPGIIPVPEDHPLRPISAHGVGKAAAEQYVRQLCWRMDMQGIVARLSNPYGPGQKVRGGSLASPPFGVVPHLMWAAITGRPFLQYNSGQNIRDFVYIDDVASALFGLCQWKQPTGCVINVGSGVGTSIAEVRRAVQKATGRPIDYKDCPPRGFDVPEIVLDNSKLCLEYGWRHMTSLEDGLKQTAEWYLSESRRRR